MGKIEKMIQVEVLSLKIEKTDTKNRQKPPELRAPGANRDGRPRQLRVRPSRLFRRGKCSAVWGKLKKNTQVEVLPLKIEKTGTENHQKPPELRAPGANPEDFTRWSSYSMVL